MPQIPPPTPWKSLVEPESDRDYVVLLTHLPLRQLTRLPRFLPYVRKIQHQLDAAPDGLVGYSLLAKPLSSNYWTLSAWLDADAIAGFIRQAPHRDAMHELPQVLHGFKTDRWTVKGHDLPPSWKDALTRIAALRTRPDDDPPADGRERQNSRPDPARPPLPQAQNRLPRRAGRTSIERGSPNAETTAASGEVSDFSLPGEPRSVSD
jgi:hypothetical protein